MTARHTYLDYITQAAEGTTEYLQRSIAQWRESFDPDNTLFGYAATGAPAAVVSRIMGMVMPRIVPREALP